MDEKMIEITTQDIEVVNSEIIENEVIAEESEQYVTTEEIRASIEVEPPKEIVIEVEEAVGWTSGDIKSHYGLTGRNEPNQHEIKAITGLREELNEIERLKTVYSDKVNVANYYKWYDAAYNESGYFVSIVPNTSSIKICDGSDIFGVSVAFGVSTDGVEFADAGFVGNQDATIHRDNAYGLIVTSGLVDVRCELEVEVGDYVVSNSKGWAKKSDSDYGYKVLATEDKDGVAYAVIALGAQADKINELGLTLGEVKEQVDANYKNIISAVNVANQAYNKATETESSNKVMSDKVDGALEKVDGVVSDVENLGVQVSNSSIVSAQAKAIAESAATSAESMKKEAVDEANKALADAVKLREDFKSMDAQITDIEDQVTIVTQQVTDQGSVVSGIRSEVDDNSAKINQLASWQGETNTSMARIEQKADANGAYIQSTVSNMDKYAVGPHSQAYGFTLSQAISVLEEGMIYVPTELHDEQYEYANRAIEIDSWDQEGKEIGEVYYAKDDKRYYYYFEEDWAWESKLDELPIHSRTFIPGYLYRWSKWTDIPYAWITVDKNYNQLEELNDSTKAVYFTPDEPVISGSFGYWYTDGDDVRMPYEPYTLYWWTHYITEGGSIEYHWVPVATLSGNSQSRAVSQIRQDANNISIEVTDTKEDVANITARVGDAEAEVSSFAAWRRGEKKDEDTKYSESIIRQTANDDGASITISAYQRAEDGSVEKESRLVLSSNNNGDALYLDASNIIINGDTTFTTKETVDGNEITRINGSHIETGSINASKISVTDLNAFNANIGGWRIGENELYSNTSLVGLFAGADWTVQSLLKDASPMRFYAGKDVTIEEEEINLEIIVNDAGPWTVSHTFDCDEIEFVRGFWEDMIPDEVDISVDGTTLTLTADYGYFQEVSDFVYVAFVKKITYGDKANFMVLEDGSLYAGAVDLKGKITATSGVFNNVDIKTGTIGGFTIGSAITSNNKTAYNDIFEGVYIGTSGIGLGSKFHISSVGELVSKGADYSMSLKDGTIMTSSLVDNDAYNTEMTGDSFILSSTLIKENITQTLKISRTGSYMENSVPAGVVYDIATGGILRLDANKYGQLMGTWSADACLETTSWRGAKHDIEVLDNRYSELFDNLNPVRFKYDNGQSDRYHTGFILDEMKSAMDAANVDSQEFAAYCVKDEETGEGGIRYEELIALLIKEVQALKKEIKEIKGNEQTIDS